MRRIEIKTRALSGNIFAGEYRSAFKGRGMSFAEVREYQPGDDVRDIDWNVTARFNRPYVKVFEEERELTLMLLVDVSGSQKFGTRNRSQRELTAEMAATLAFSAMQNNDKIGVIFFSDCIEKYIPPKKGRSHILYIIREMLNIEPKSRLTDVAQALEFMTRVVTKRCICFVMSDFMAPLNYERPLMIAARKHDVVALRTFDAVMDELPDAGLIKVADAETGGECYIDTSSGKVRKAYAAQRAVELSELEALLRKTGVDLAHVRTDADFVRPLMNLFAKR